MVEQEYKTSLKSGDPTDDDIQLKEQFPAGDEFAPKVRKPYTITKQRERWTEDEHKNFLEALKLYGRAWRRIEDHVGTKTAVQIRSHAQKFFSKVVRDSNIGDSTKPIEIPPPRPKKKPVHPYPRKLVSPVKTGIWIPEKRAMLICPNTFEQENRSPKSILSAVRSDSSGGADSCMPNGSPSSVSSALALNTAKSFGSEVCKFSSEDVICSRLDHEDEKLSSYEEMPLALDLSCQNMEFVKGDSNESATQSLKLFGKTLFVENPYENSCTFPVRVMPLKLPTSNILYTQITIENSNPADAFPWLSLCSNESDSSPVVPSPTRIKAQSLYAKKEKSDNDEQNDGSSTGSNTDLVNDSFPIPLEQKGSEEKSFSCYKLSKRISSVSLKNRSGFVPYKRCFAEQDCTIYSRETDEERERQDSPLTLKYSPWCSVDINK